MDCPICFFPVADARGLAAHFRHQSATHPDYSQWKEDQQWVGKTEGVDFVRCLECGHRAATLARHLKAAHNITADEYRSKHGDVLIRPSKVTERRQAAIKRGRQESTAYDGVKTVLCPSCGVGHEVHKLSMPIRCPACKAMDEDARWAGLVEPEDYVTCLDCGHRAENLTSHVQNAHPDYRERHPDALMVALRSAVRDKTALQGLHRTPEFKHKIREAKLIGLTPESFDPFKEPDGTIDHRAMMKVVGCAWPTLKRYMDEFGLVPTRKYIEQAGEDRRVVLDVEDLEKFKIGNGKVSVAKAMAELGYCHHTIKRECRRLGLDWAHGNVSQRKCMDAVSEALGGLPYEMEWRSRRFMSAKNAFYRFDAMFPDVGLIVEFHGHQHYTFPNAYMIDESYLPEYEALRERDRIKREMIEAAPDLIYFEVREDEPYTDPMYLKGRLHQMGVV